MNGFAVAEAPGRAASTVRKKLMVDMVEDEMLGLPTNLESGKECGTMQEMNRLDWANQPAVYAEQFHEQWPETHDSCIPFHRGLLYKRRRSVAARRLYSTA